MNRALLVLSSVLFLAACTGGNQPPAGTCTTDSQCNGNKCCAGKCVDVKTSLTHCGACSNFCSTVHGAASCTEGVCGIKCATGFGDCNQMVKDGCETNLDDNVNNCGTCANLCLAPNADVFCERGECLQSGCFGGWGNCNQSAADGCETNTKSSNDHCGACNKKCEVAEGLGQCVSSACTVAMCNPGFGDCDMNATTGCETDIRVSVDHCGVCGLVCDPGYKCKVGKCVAPEIVFYGGLISVNSSLTTDAVSAFNVDTHLWTTVNTQGAEKPGPRASHLAVWDPAANQMIVWGGFGQGGAGADTIVWALDFNGDLDAGTTDGGPLDPVWKKLATTGGPSSRNGFAFAFDKVTRRFFIYGGTDANNNNTFNELWQFDVATKTWTQRLESGGPFDGRFLLTGAWDSTTRRFVFGSGYDDFFTASNEFFAFDPAADGGNYTALPISGAPEERLGSTFLGDAVPLYLYGGFSDFGDVFDDLYRVDFTDGGAIEWSLQTPANNILPARAYAAGTSTVDRRFVYGGMSYINFTSVSQNEVWEFSADAGWKLLDSTGDAGPGPIHPGTAYTTGVARE